MKETHFHGCHLDLTRKLEATVGHARALTMREVIESFYKDCIEPSLPEVRRGKPWDFHLPKKLGKVRFDSKNDLLQEVFFARWVL